LLAVAEEPARGITRRAAENKSIKSMNDVELHQQLQIKNKKMNAIFRKSYTPILAGGIWQAIGQG
jgi:hypothetical protein